MIGFLVFITLCLTIAILSLLVSIRNNNRTTDQRIDNLHYAMDALHHKVDTLYHDTKNATEQQMVQPQAQQAAQSPVQPAPTQAYQKPILAQTHPQPLPVYPQQVPAQAHPQPAPIYMHPQPLPAHPQAGPVYPYMQTPPAQVPHTNMEKVIGKNILPFLAAGMVFIGLIFLAILVVPSLNDMQRFVAMYALAATIFATGFGLALRKKNIFSVALLGTGIGSLFISILMTRIYFNYLGDIPTFILLLVWMVACMGFVKMFNSLTLSITAHVGMVISIVFAFTQGFDQERAFIVIAYQIIATVVIVGASLIAYRKTYRLGLGASFVLTLIATIAIRNQDFAIFSTSTVVVSLLVQFVTASVLSFLLAASSAKASRSTRLGLHWSNKALWIILVIVALYPAVFYVMYPEARHLTETQELIHNTVPSLVCIAVLLIHALISAILQRAIQLPADMVRVSVITTISAAAVMALYRSSIEAMHHGIVIMPFLCLLALFSLAITHLLRERAYTILAIVLLAVDAVIAMASIFLTTADTSPTLSFVWIAAIMATSIAVYASWLPETSRRLFLPGLILLNLVFIEVTFPQPIPHILSWDFAWPLGLVVPLFIVAVLRIVNIEVAIGMSKTYHVLFAVNEGILATAAIFTVTINTEDISTTRNVLLWLATALVAIIYFARIVQSRNISALHPQPVQYISAIMLTFVTQAPLVGLIDLADSYPFVSSVVAMFVALVLVGVGFALRLKPVRLYGLGLTIFVVLKLATYDLSNISSVGRVIAFIVGGLIAFGISALYNYADKRLTHTGPRQNGQGPAPHMMGAQPVRMPYAQPQPGQPQPIPMQATPMQAAQMQVMPQHPMQAQPLPPQQHMQAHSLQGQMPMSQMPSAGQVPMAGPVPTSQVPVQTQPVTAQPPMAQRPIAQQPMQAQPTPAQPAQAQPAVGQPAPTQPVMPHEQTE